LFDKKVFPVESVSARMPSTVFVVMMFELIVLPVLVVAVPPGPPT